MPAKATKTAQAKASRLKVFQAQFGFYDSVVAAPSRPAALRAWGTHQNLFAGGQAGLTTDAAAVEAALAHPEVPLRRPVGSNDPFEIEPARLPDVPDAPRRPAGQRRTAAAVPPSPKKVADRSKLDAAERALRDLDAGRRDEEDQLKQRQSDLEAEILVARTAYLERRKAAKAAVAAAREAFRKQGGTL